MFDLCLPVMVILVGRQAQELVRKRMLQGSKQPAAKELAQRLEWQEEGAAGVTPLTSAVQAASRDQAVQVRMVAEVAAPGVQGHEQAGQGAEVARVGAQVEQAGASGVEEQAGHEAAVELPQADEAVGQGEDDVEMRARQQLGQLCGQPTLARRLGAAWTAAVATGVVLHRGEVALGARQHVHAHGGPEALADAVGRALLARVQHMGLGVLAKVLPEDVLQGRVHAQCISCR